MSTLIIAQREGYGNIFYEIFSRVSRPFPPSSLIGGLGSPPAPVRSTEQHRKL